MSQTLIAAASGLLAHQRKLDIVANNLANLNTTGYKAQRILFSDLDYNTIQSAGSSSVFFGGTNPRQTGFGVNVATTSRNYGQGVLTGTGAQFDFAIDGDGFFVVNDGTNNYTRAGAFSLDSNGYLVDPATGGFVQRFGVTGEGLDGVQAFQDPNDMRIKIPLGIGIKGQVTRKTNLTGNLPAAAKPPQAGVLTTLAGFETPAGPATSTTLLNDLVSNTTDYVPGDSLDIIGTNIDGSPINITLPVDGTTTVGDLINAYNGVLVGATAALQADGNITLTADNVGPNSLDIQVRDTAGNTGHTGFNSHSFIETVEGKDGDKSTSTLQVFDERGQPHTLNVEFEKATTNGWITRFSVIDGSGTVSAGAQMDLIFNENGQFRTANGTTNGTADIELTLDSLTAPQTIQISFDQLTHFATHYATTFDQDGFPPGNLANVSVNPDGILEGIATNGQHIPIAQLAIASFINVQSLEAKGQNYYQETVNSGIPQIGAGLSSAKGIVRGGQLESSNVDIAIEFTQLIVAQRGFSANARTITVASEVLQELTNIVR